MIAPRIPLLLPAAAALSLAAPACQRISPSILPTDSHGRAEAGREPLEQTPAPAANPDRREFFPRDDID